MPRDPTLCAHLLRCPFQDRATPLPVKGARDALRNLEADVRAVDGTTRRAQGQTRDDKKQKNETSDSTTYVTEIHTTLWRLLTDTFPHVRTIMYMVTAALNQI